MKIMFVGDLNLGEYYPSIGNGPGTVAKKEYLFAKVHDIFSQADMVVGNLEASITSKNSSKTDFEEMVLKVDPSISPQLSRAGFGIVQVANNHSIQHGETAFYENLSILERLSIKAVGINNQDPIILTEDGVTIGFMAASDVPDNTNKLQTMYQRMDEEFFERVQKNAGLVDHLVIMLHWGLEESTVPLLYQREIAARLRHAGVSAIIGSHTHLFYEIEAEENFICAYSLGNFVFDLCWDKRLLKTGILEIDFFKDRVQGKVWPVEITRNGAIPQLCGDSVPLEGVVKLYDHGSSLKWQQLRKIFYLLVGIFKGKTLIKLRFFRKKYGTLLEKHLLTSRSRD